MAGKVPMPKLTITNAPDSASGALTDQSRIEYTKPQGSQPQRNPSATACQTDFIGNKRLLSGEILRQMGKPRRSMCAHLGNQPAR